RRKLSLDGPPVPEVIRAALIEAKTGQESYVAAGAATLLTLSRRSLRSAASPNLGEAIAHRQAAQPFRGAAVRRCAFAFHIDGSRPGPENNKCERSLPRRDRQQGARAGLAVRSRIADHHRIAHELERARVNHPGRVLARHALEQPI